MSLQAIQFGHAADGGRDGAGEMILFQETGRKTEEEREREKNERGGGLGEEQEEDKEGRKDEGVWGGGWEEKGEKRSTEGSYQMSAWLNGRETGSGT